MRRWFIRGCRMALTLAVVLVFAIPLCPTSCAAEGDGFTPLFNGKDLAGWTLAGDPSWSVEDGAIYCSGKGGGYLWTDAEFEDCILRLEYKISPGGNSGVFPRGRQQAPADRGWEVQILDDPAYPKVKPEGRAGAIYKVAAPYRYVSRPAGEWNQLQITCEQGHIVVVMNGVKIVDAESDQFPELAKRPRKGRIGLQNHHTPVWFRNIEIAPLPIQLFNGRDLTGWNVDDGPAASWSAVDGVLTCSGQGGGWARTEKQYRDFLLRLEYAISPGGNSGIFVRAAPEGNPAFTGMEVQVMDDYGKPADIHGAGSIYGAVAPCRNMSKPAGEWNSVAIMCKGSHMTVTMNGIKTIDIDLDDPALNALDIQERKLKDRVREGYIGLQNHGSLVRYRNIRINPL